MSSSTGYRGATRDSIAGRRMLAVVEAAQGKRGEGPCAWPGCTSPWVQVDHIESRAEHPELADDPTNWQGLCGFHNASKGKRSPSAGRVAVPATAPAGAGTTSRAWLG